MPINKQEELSAEQKFSKWACFNEKIDLAAWQAKLIWDYFDKSILEAKQSGIEEERSKNNMAVLGVITSLGYEGVLTSDQIIELNTRLSEALKE